jgi:hypothetical protein
MLLAAGCGDSPSVEQTADQVVTVTVTKTVGTTDGTPTDDGSTSTEEPSDQGLAGIGDTITLRGYEEGTEVAVTVTHLIDPAQAEQYFGPKRGHKYVAVDLVLKNAGTRPTVTRLGMARLCSTAQTMDIPRT